MGLVCNIDQRGRRVRLVAGITTDVLGCGLIIAGIITNSAMLLGAGVVACLGGGFMVFEGAAGWCALRALGFKTKL